MLCSIVVCVEAINRACQVQTKESLTEWLKTPLYLTCQTDREPEN